jgi:hypothetical protein
MNTAFDIFRVTRKIVYPVVVNDIDNPKEMRTASNEYYYLFNI